MDDLIVVTGALGNVGAQVVETLGSAGARVIAADLNVDALEERFGAEVEPAHLDFTDHSTFAPVLAHATKIFLIRPPAISRVGDTINPFIDAASSQVSHIVFSSVAGADENRIVPHHRIEEHLKESDIPWTMLRPGFFAQNIATAYRQDIVEHDRMYLPAKDGLVAFIDSRDIGGVAALALTEPGHEEKAYHLTGPEAFTFYQVAEMLSTVLGRTIRYEEASVLAYFNHLRLQGLVFPHALVQTILHTGLRRGDAEEVTSTVSDLLGRPARNLQAYLEENRSFWLV